jgi:hypothetical protein
MGAPGGDYRRGTSLAMTTYQQRKRCLTRH